MPYPVLMGYIGLLYLLAALVKSKRVVVVADKLFSAFLALLLPLALLEWYSAGGGLVYEAPFISSPGIGSFSAGLDAVSIPVLSAVSIVTAAIAYYSKDYMVRRIEELGLSDVGEHLSRYYALYMLFSASMAGVAVSTNMLELYMFLELALISSFLLINYYGYGDRRRIALLYFVWTHIGAVSFLVGSLIYGFYSYSFDYIVNTKGVLYGWGEGFLPGKSFYWAFLLMLIGLLVKTAVFGLHLWLPYAHAEAPTPVSSLLSPLLIGFGPYAILRFLYPLFPSVFHEASLVLVLLSLATIIYGGLTALWEPDVKRFLAYSSISQMGYLLLGASVGNVYGLAGLVVHYLAHGLSKAVLFGSAGSIIYHTGGKRRIDEMGGIASNLPLTSASSFLGFLGITGIPPALGFWGEVFILRGLVRYAFQSYTHPIILVFLVFLGFSLTLAYSFRNFRRIFLGPGRHGFEGENAGIAYPLLVMAVLLVVLFILAPIISQWLISYIGGIIG